MNAQFLFIPGEQEWNFIVLGMRKNGLKLILELDLFSLLITISVNLDLLKQDNF